MFSLNSPITDAPWYLTASGLLLESSALQVAAAIDKAARNVPERAVFDLSTAERVETGVVIQLASLVERGRLNVIVQLGRLAPALPPKLAAVLGESQVEASEALLGHIRHRREQGLEDSEAIRALLARLRPADAPA